MKFSRASCSNRWRSQGKRENAQGQSHAEKISLSATNQSAIRSFSGSISDLICVRNIVKMYFFRTVSELFNILQTKSNAA